jgi:hypothetical protein
MAIGQLILLRMFGRPRGVLGRLGAIIVARTNRRHAATAAQLPWPDKSFDKAVAINTIQVWSDRVVGLCEIRRVLKCNGRPRVGLYRLFRAKQSWHCRIPRRGRLQ